MRNIKLKIFIVLALTLSQTNVFCEAAGDSVGGDLIKEIRELRVKVLNAIQGRNSAGEPSSVISALNKIFIAEDGSVGNNTSANQSVIGKSIDMYATNFYSFYTNNSANNSVEINKSEDINYSYSKAVSGNNTSSDSGNPSNNSTNGDLIVIEKKTKRGASDLVKQDIYYATQKSFPEKIRDFFALLLVKAEGGKNNIDSNDIPTNRYKGGSNAGSLYIANATAIQASEGIQDIMDVNVLIGPDGYYGDAADNAKVFINQLIQASPAPKTFSFPEAKTASGKVTIYLPYADSDGNPYTAVDLSLEQNGTGCSDGKSCPSQYQMMLSMLNSNSIYQKYKMKFRSKMAMRTLYLGNIFRIFQERYKEKASDKSLVEKEKEMAMVGLTKTYYDDLTKKSVADVNLEMLHTLNKVVYFLYKLHQDNERSLLMTSVSGSMSQILDTQDEKDYFKPLGVLIRNGCWDLKDPYPSIRSNDQDRSAACDRPLDSTAY